MKKVLLTSLVAVFAAANAHAANIIDGNPLYRPGEGRFYSNFAVESHSEAIEDWKIAEEFGYGVTNEFKLFLKTDAKELEGFDFASWDNFAVGADYRVYDAENWKADVYGEYSLSPVWGDRAPILEEATTSYTWTLGARAGYVGDGWTVAGHVDFDYLNSESFNWGDDGIHKLSMGVDGQLVLCPKWNLIAGVEYTGILDDEIAGVDVKDAGKWTGKFGVNYNLDEAKYIGLYIMGESEHATGDWETAEGFGFGANFGIEF